MKLVWVEVKHEDMEFQFKWTKENGWVQKPKPTEPIYVLRQEK